MFFSNIYPAGSAERLDKTPIDELLMDFSTLRKDKMPSFEKHQDHNNVKNTSLLTKFFSSIRLPRISTWSKIMEPLSVTVVNDISDIYETPLTKEEQHDYSKQYDYSEQYKIIPSVETSFSYYAVKQFRNQAYPNFEKETLFPRHGYDDTIQSDNKTIMKEDFVQNDTHLYVALKNDFAMSLSPSSTEEFYDVMDNSYEMKDNSDEMKDNSDEMKDNSYEMKDNSYEMKDNSDEMKDNSDEMKDNSYDSEMDLQWQDAVNVERDSFLVSNQYAIKLPDWDIPVLTTKDNVTKTSPPMSLFQIWPEVTNHLPPELDFTYNKQLCLLKRFKGFVTFGRGYKRTKSLRRAGTSHTKHRKTRSNHMFHHPVKDILVDKNLQNIKIDKIDKADGIERTNETKGIFTTDIQIDKDFQDNRIEKINGIDGTNEIDIIDEVDGINDADGMNETYKILQNNYDFLTGVDDTEDYNVPHGVIFKQLPTLMIFDVVDKIFEKVQKARNDCIPEYFSKNADNYHKVHNDEVYDFQRDPFRLRTISETSIESEDSCIIFAEESDMDVMVDVSCTNVPSYEDDDSDDEEKDNKEFMAPKVKFNLIPTVRTMIQWDYAYRAARKGPWEEMARDRERFKRRVHITATVLDPILTSEHRANIWKKRFGPQD